MPTPSTSVLVVVDNTGPGKPGLFFMKIYIYFHYTPNGKKDIKFIVAAKDIVEADANAKKAGVDYMKHQCQWATEFLFS